jgi:hypothetical protein
MMIIIALAVVAVFTLLFLLRYIRGYEAPIGTLQELAASSAPVDLHSFRNLIDPAEEEYLRTNLPLSEFRGVQRARMRAAVDYVRRTSHNAALLLRIGQAARHSSDPNTARAAQQLMNSALQLRIYSMLALCIFYARTVAPTARISAGTFIDRYERLRDRMASLARLQVPATVSRLTSSI